MILYDSLNLGAEIKMDYYFQQFVVIHGFLLTSMF